MAVEFVLEGLDRQRAEQLLGHRSGIGDFLDEDAGVDLDDYLLTVPPNELADQTLMQQLLSFTREDLVRFAELGVAAIWERL